MLLLGIAETVLCLFLCFTVGIVQCVYQFTSAHGDYCNVSSDRTVSGRFAPKYFSFLFDCPVK